MPWTHGLSQHNFSARSFAEARFSERPTNSAVIKQQIRDAFYQDADDWKEMIWERGIETQKLAIAGLAQG